MAQTVEQIEHDLERARRERDVWKNSRHGHANYQMASVMVSALEKEFSETISGQAKDGKDDDKTSDSP